MYAATITSTAFDAAFARWDGERQAGEDYDEVFRAYAEANDYDLDDDVQYATANARFDAILRDERDL